MNKSVVVLAFVGAASLTFAQEGPERPVSSRSVAAANPSTQSAREPSGLKRDVCSFGAELERAIFNPGNLRVAESRGLSSLDRVLEPGEEVVVLEPAGFVVRPSSAAPGHGIEYVWEVLVSDRGVLVAVPVPVLESFTRAPKPCEGCTPSLPKGKCSSAGFCFGELPVDKHCMTKMDTTDVGLVLKLCVPEKKTAAGLQANVDFAVSYAVRNRGEARGVAIWGTASARPVSNTVWAGTLVDGVGYFLDDTHDGAGVTGVSAAAAASVNAVIADQGMAARFAYGIKEKGIK